MSKSIEDYKEFFVPPITKEILLMLLEKVTKVLEDNNIKYFIEGGTILGAVRHKGFIPWDDDIDLGVFDKDFDKLIPLFISNIQDHQYEIKVQRSSEDMIKVFVAEMWLKHKDNGHIVGTPTLDIFRYRQAGDYIKLASVKERKRFPNCIYKKDEFYPLKKYQFESLHVYGPNNPMPFLLKYYGRDVMTTYKVDIRKEDNAIHKDRNQIIQTSKSETANKLCSVNTA